MLILGVVFVIVSKKKVVADENGLIAGGRTIAYDSIEQIDRTHFKTKGYFVITYKDGGGSGELKLSDRNYDNLLAVLDEVAAKIS